MNPRDALRRYLEQRRELGESELVLDSMSVEEVLALVGLKGGGAVTTPAPAPRPAPPPDDVRAPADHPRLEPGAEAPPARAAAPAPPVARAEEPGDAEPGAPIDTDWRAMLRAAGGAPEPRAAAAPRPAAPRPADPPADAAPAAESRAAPPEPAPPVDTRRWDIPDVGAPTGLVVGGDALEGSGDAEGALESLDAIARAVAVCTRCPLHRTATHPVPGEGNPNADLVIVGEAPGAEEDASGRPFVGASGQLLTKILAAISLSREEVFICNVVKHRPPGNRNPEPDEVAACSPYLVRQLELIRPKAILTLGNFAAQTLLGTKLGISKLRGQVHRYHGIPLVATYHPAALLRNPTWKRPTWEDVQLARRILDRADAR